MTLKCSRDYAKLFRAKNNEVYILLDQYKYKPVKIPRYYFDSLGTQIRPKWISVSPIYINYIICYDMLRLNKTISQVADLTHSCKILLL